MKLSELIYRYRKGTTITALAELSGLPRHEVLQALRFAGQEIESTTRPRTWDTDKALALHSQGKTDREIAEAVGVSRQVIYNWRQESALPINRERSSRQ